MLGVGANSIDFVYRLPAYPEPAGPFSKMRIREQAICCGGQTATALATCVSLGLTAKYIGATGTDENGSRIRTELARRGIDTSDAVIRDIPNQFAIIMVDEERGERIVLWDRDERLQLRPRDLPADTVASARLIHVDDVDQPAAIAPAHGAQAGLPVTSDIDRVTDLPGAGVRSHHSDLAEHVPAELTGKADHQDALRQLRESHHHMLIVTLGARGAVALYEDRFIVSPGFPIHAIDTTGAGDVFRGGLVYALLQEWPAERALRFANAAAAVSCTRLGALNGVPSLVEIEETMRAEIRC